MSFEFIVLSLSNYKDHILPLNLEQTDPSTYISFSVALLHLHTQGKASNNKQNWLNCCVGQWS